MADTATSVAKKPAKATSSRKKTKAKPSQPPTGDMVTTAIKNLKESGGSSLQAIKKYIADNYKADADKLAPFIRKYLKSAVTSGKLIQTKGKDASGFFKLADKAKVAAPKKAKPLFDGHTIQVAIKKRRGSKGMSKVSLDSTA